MSRVTAVLPGYATVARAGELLHLAPRSVRDLIYGGRLPSLRIGRLHYLRAADVELERRRRLGLRLPSRATRTPRPRLSTRQPGVERPRVDPALRRQRALERAGDVTRWAKRHSSSHVASVPFASLTAGEATTCATCGRAIRVGARVVVVPQQAPSQAGLCLTCGRRAILDWADRRRLEAAAARRMAEDLGSSPESPFADTPRAA
jgi:hypothetical protein